MNPVNDDIVPQAYNLTEESWLTIMSFETSMGMIGLAEFYLETGDSGHRETMVGFTDLLLDTFEVKDSLWTTVLDSQTGRMAPCNYFTKSFGYIVEGLMAVHKAVPDRGYLETAQKIAEHLLKAQTADGWWPVRWDRTAEDVGVCDKGTALWSCLFLRLYKTTNDRRYLKAGTKALEWCIHNQYFGNDPMARGGIVGRSWPSGIIYRHWFDIITT